MIMKRMLASMTGLALLMGMVGCDGAAMSLNGSDMTPSMMDKGIVYILPGIQGVDYHYKNIRQGLRGAGLNSLMVGTRQSSYPPVLHLAAPATACLYVFLLPGFFCHMSPVFKSVTVPSPLSL